MQRCGGKKRLVGDFTITYLYKRLQTDNNYLKNTKTLAGIMLAQKQPTLCLSCGKAVKGRSDKKFCDDYCRAAYNNELKSATNNYVRKVNNALSKNRRILESILPQGEATAKVSRDKLMEKGFQFKYLTYIHKTKNGNTYFYCYEYGYLPLENNWYLVVRKEEEK